MQKKKDFMRLLLCLGICMVIFAGWIVVTDPFYHYHKPWFNMPVILGDVVYQSPGNATNLEYSDAILGTSMTENFRVSWFDEELAWDTMKLSYSGATSDDIHQILECMYENDRQIEHILMDLNDYQLSEPADRVYVERPEYLYSKVVLDDYRYLYNHDVFVLGMERVLSALKGEGSNIETAFTWDGEELFGKERVLESARSAKEMLLAEQEERLAQEQSISEEDVSKNIEEAQSVCQDNLDNIIPFIEEHPETEFNIFFPPYSVLYWEQVALQDEIEEKIAMYTYAIEQLLPYENIKIFYFQGEDFIEDLDEYRDITHHKPEYNRYIFECVRDDKKRLTEENYKEELDKVYQKVKDYDYEGVWE